MSSLWAAPFMGEFGWECAVWAPWLRYQQDRLQLPMTVVCEKGKALLYGDFARIVEQQPSIMIRDCQHALTPKGGKLVKEDYENYVTKAAGGAQKCITPLDLQVTWAGGPPAPRFSIYKNHRVHGEEPLLRNTIALHARDHQHTERNWSQARWEHLVGIVDCDFISVGTKDGSLWVPGTEDHRGIDLGELALDLSRCEAIVGPSSGPLAFAMLCDLAVVWWSGHAKNGPRFDHVWNPFDVPVTHVAPNWSPTVTEVAKACQKYS